MNIWECILMAIEGVRTNKLRSSLTMLGIVIGIAAVISVVAIGQGGRALLMTEIEKFGTNLFAIYVDFRSDKPATAKDFVLEDVELIKSLVPTVRGLTPANSSMTQVESDRKGKFAQVYGSLGDYAQMHNVELYKGRFFTNSEAKSERKVVVLEDKLARDIFGREEALGRRVTINNVQLTVIGLAKSNGSILSGGFNSCYIPFGVWQQAFGDDVIRMLEGQTYPGENIKAAMDKAVTILERKHDNKGRYMSQTSEQQLQVVGKITGILTLVVGAVAGISLFVGGIGVMNIMLVSVTERTREIGIRKSLGARRQDIMIQFLIESLVICSIGGIVGMLIGIGGAFLIATFAKWPPLVSWSTVIISFCFSSAVGLFFGIYPASKAAKLDPIEALRYE
ncbi:MAG TPA: ABC transporter permease [Bacillota bacterium]|nr:ABC transporter permease [Bacillota bacterium]